MPPLAAPIRAVILTAPNGPRDGVPAYRMQHCDTLISADWCIPVHPDTRVLARYAVAVRDGRIIDLLPVEEARKAYRASVIADRPGHALIPGFVNAHTHAPMSLLRGLVDDLPLELWLKQAVWPIEARWGGPEMVRDGTRLAIAEMLLGGCTCFSDQYFFPEIVAETAVDMHMRAVIGTPVIDFETPWSKNADECLAKGADRVHDPYADHPLVSTCFAPHSTGTLSDKSFAALRVLADQLDRPIQMHLHESRQEIENEIKSSGKRPFERLRDLGLVNSSLMAVHAVHVTDEEIGAFADAGVVVAHCPNSNLKLADGIARTQDFLDAGVTVGLGTDSAASNNLLDMRGEMRTAALLAKASSANAAAVPAFAALHMATMGGATALGLDADIGSIEVGKWADLACVDLSRLNSQPMYDPVSQLVYATHSDQVRDVWVAGRHHVEAGKLRQIDENEILRRTSEWQQRLNHREPTENP